MFIFFFRSSKYFLFNVKNSVDVGTPDAFLKHPHIWVLIVIIVLDNFLFHCPDDLENWKINSNHEKHYQGNILSIGRDKLNCCYEDYYILVDT